MKYHILPEEPLSEGDYSLVSIRHRDFQDIRQWRNEQIQYLRQRFPISETQQENYWEQAVFPTFQQVHPPQVLLSFLQRGKCVGYGGLVHLDWDDGRGEVSFLLETQRANNVLTYQNEFALFLRLLKQLAFAHLGLRRLTTETYDVRPVTVKVLEAAGFKLEGRLRKHHCLTPDDADNPQPVDSLVHGLLREDG